jgi:hypothetical protein
MKGEGRRCQGLAVPAGVQFLRDGSALALPLEAVDRVVRLPEITPQTEATALLAQVDAALCRATHGGRNQIWIEQPA